MSVEATTRVAPRASASVVLLAAGLAAGVGRATQEVRSTSAPHASAKCNKKPTDRALSLPQRLPRPFLAVPIPMYHRINVPSPTARAITLAPRQPPDFERQMRWLKRRG